MDFLVYREFESIVAHITHIVLPNTPSRKMIALNHLSKWQPLSPLTTSSYLLPPSYPSMLPSPCTSSCLTAKLITQGVHCSSTVNIHVRAQKGYYLEQACTKCTYKRNIAIK